MIYINVVLKIYFFVLFFSFFFFRSAHRAYLDAKSILAMEVHEHGSLGDETMTEDELYIRHEHRVHLPFHVLPKDVLENIDVGFGKCVTTLGM